jgi:hypothetical protein
VEVELGIALVLTLKAIIIVGSALETALIALRGLIPFAMFALMGTFLTLKTNAKLVFLSVHLALG